jgi:hypothetical protein
MESYAVHEYLVALTSIVATTIAELIKVVVPYWLKKRKRVKTRRPRSSAK